MPEPSTADPGPDAAPGPERPPRSWSALAHALIAVAIAGLYAMAPGGGGPGGPEAGLALLLLVQAAFASCAPLASPSPASSALLHVAVGAPPVAFLAAVAPVDGRSVLLALAVQAALALAAFSARAALRERGPWIALPVGVGSALLAYRVLAVAVLGGEPMSARVGGGPFLWAAAVIADPQAPDPPALPPALGDDARRSARAPLGRVYRPGIPAPIEVRGAEGAHAVGLDAPDAAVRIVAGGDGGRAWVVGREAGAGGPAARLGWSALAPVEPLTLRIVPGARGELVDDAGERIVEAASLPGPLAALRAFDRIDGAPAGAAREVAAFEALRATRRRARTDPGLDPDLYSLSPAPVLARDVLVLGAGLAAIGALLGAGAGLVRRRGRSVIAAALALASSAGAWSASDVRVIAREDAIACALPDGSVQAVERLTHLLARAPAAVRLRGPAGVPLEPVLFDSREAHPCAIVYGPDGAGALEGLVLGRRERRLYRTMRAEARGTLERAGALILNRTEDRFEHAWVLEGRSARRLPPVDAGGAIDPAAAAQAVPWSALALELPPDLEGLVTYARRGLRAQRTLALAARLDEAALSGPRVVPGWRVVLVPLD